MLNELKFQKRKNDEDNDHYDDYDDNSSENICNFDLNERKIMQLEILPMHVTC